MLNKVILHFSERPSQEMTQCRLLWFTGTPEINTKLAENMRLYSEGIFTLSSQEQPCLAAENVPFYNVMSIVLPAVKAIENELVSN